VVSKRTQTAPKLPRGRACALRAKRTTIRLAPTSSCRSPEYDQLSALAGHPLPRTERKRALIAADLCSSSCEADVAESERDGLFLGVSAGSSPAF
jgi:hypothetical protein